jgi:hypothetical protein
MFNELTKIIYEKIEANKKATLVAVSMFALAILLFVGFSNFNKATLEVSFSAPDGNVEVLISTLDAEKELPEGKVSPGDAIYPTVHSSSKRDSKVKLKPGKYDVNAVVTFKNNDQEVKVKASQTIELKKRTTQRVSLIAKTPPQAQKIDEADRVSHLGFSSGKLYSTSNYGVTDFYSVDDNYSKQTIRNEPAFLKTVRSICHFSNGNAVAVDYSGKFYKIVESTATVLDMSAIPSDEITENFSLINSFAFDDSSLICTGDNFYVYGFASINKDFTISQRPMVVSPKNYKNYKNYQTNYSGGLFLFNYPGAVSIIEPESAEDKSKNVLFLENGPGSDELELDIGSSPGFFSSYNSDKFCYSENRGISCRRAVKDSPVDFNFETSEYVTNILMISEDKLVYTTDKTIWVLDLSSSEKRNIFSLSDDKATGTLAFSRDLQTLAFSVQAEKLPRTQVGGPSSNYDGPSLNSIYIIKTEDL